MTKISKVVSLIFQPVFILLYCAILMQIVSPIGIGGLYNVWGDITIFGLIILFTILIPLSVIFYEYKLGKISNIYLTERRERTKIYLISMISALICAYLICALFQSYLFVFFLAFGILALVTVTVINLWWKISMHSCGVGILCGFVNFLSFIYNVDIVWLLCTMIFIAGLVMTSRCVLKAHTLGQTIAGYFIGLFFALIPIPLLFFAVY